MASIVKHTVSRRSFIQLAVGAAVLVPLLRLPANTEPNSPTPQNIRTPRETSTTHYIYPSDDVQKAFETGLPGDTYVFMGGIYHLSAPLSLQDNSQIVFRSSTRLEGSA